METETITFFVYIVESPSAPDLYHGRSEGERVANTLRLDGVPCVTITAINHDAFIAALRIGLTEAMKLFPTLSCSPSECTRVERGRTTVNRASNYLG